MRIAVHAPFSPLRGIGSDAVRFAVALAQHADVVVKPMGGLPPGRYPAAFRRLTAGGSADVDLVMGSPAQDPPGRRSVVWAYPAAEGAPHDEWALVIATNRFAATDMNTAAVCALGVDVEGFEPAVRTSGVLRIDETWDYATRQTLAHRFAGSLIGTVTDPAHFRYAAQFAATGGCVIGPAVDDLANLIHPDWAVPATVDGISAAVAGALADVEGTIGRGRAAASYVRSGLSWSTAAERVALLVRRTL